MTKGNTLILAREEFGPAAHVKIVEREVKEETPRVTVGVCQVGLYDLMGFRVLGEGSDWEYALEEARKK